MPKLSIILPVLDEESIIEKVVHNIQQILSAAKIDYEIILVENGSVDNTWQVVQDLSKRDASIKAIQAKKGYGSAVIAGLALAQAKWVGYMPSDGQIDATLLPLLFSEFQKNTYQLVKVKRINRENWVRFIASKIFNLLVLILFPIDIVDINGSPRIFEKKYLPILDLSYKDSFIDTEFAVKAHILGWNIREIPMRNLDRVGGKSTVKLATVLEFLQNLWNFRFNSTLDIWKKEQHIR